MLNNASKTTPTPPLGRIMEVRDYIHAAKNVMSFQKDSQEKLNAYANSGKRWFH